jgi:hypothetical protein
MLLLTTTTQGDWRQLSTDGEARQHCELRVRAHHAHVRVRFGMEAWILRRPRLSSKEVLFLF